MWAAPFHTAGKCQHQGWQRRMSNTWPLKPIVSLVICILETRIHGATWSMAWIPVNLLGGWKNVAELPGGCLEGNSWLYTEVAQGNEAKVRKVHIMGTNYPLSDMICLRWTAVDLNLQWCRRLDEVNPNPSSEEQDSPCRTFTISQPAPQ